MSNDGLRYVLSAIHTALKGGQEPLNSAQLAAIRNVVMALFIDPSIPFDEAIHLVEQLEGAGLPTDPPEFEALIKILSDIEVE